MNEPRELFKPLDSLESPDRWLDVERQVGHGGDADVPRRGVARIVGLVAATLALTVGIVAVLAVAFRPSGSSPGDETDAPSAPTELSAEGTSFTFPDGWYGRADSLPGYTRRIFQVSTFPLPPLRDIEALEARASLNAEDILIVMNEFSSICPPCPSESEGLPVVITREDLQGAHDVPKWLSPLDDLPQDVALARRVFSVGPRYFDLTVEFGADPSQADLDRANEVIGSLSIGDWAAEENGECQWNELGIRDPDCPEGEWLQTVVAEAGFQIRDLGGSPVARGNGTEAFISAEDEDRVSNDHLNLLEDPSAFPTQREIDGIIVYGNDQEWVWFASGVHVVVSLGPYGDSPFPTFQQLKPLVEASLDVKFRSSV
jgi:hypothetical protein